MVKQKYFGVFITVLINCNMQILSRLILNSQEREEMDIGEVIPVEGLTQVLTAIEPVP